MSTHLLDRLGRFAPGTPRFNGPVEDHVCVLMLFDGYEGHRCRLAYDRRWIVQRLLSTYPFDELYRRGRNQSVVGGLLLFTAPVPPTSGSGTRRYRFDPDCDGESTTIDETKLHDFIRGLHVGTFLDGDPTWLDSQSRSHGLVGVVINDRYGRDAHHGSYFTVTGTRDKIQGTFVHELGHGFELSDEYEDRGEPCVSSGGRRAPNVVDRSTIETPQHAATVPLDPGDVVRANVPWDHYLSDPPLVVDHPRRSSMPSNPASSWNCHIGPITEDPDAPAPVSRVGLWEGGFQNSIDAFRAEPYCIMRNQFYQVYDPSPPPPPPPPAVIRTGPNAGFIIEIGPIEMLSVVTVAPPCADMTRGAGDPQNFESRVASSYVPFCTACSQWIRYRAGLPDRNDPDEWSRGQSLNDRIGAFQRWVTRHGR